MATSSNFASVKLPAELVQQAREAAQPLRRSAAGQIEYWATLGRAVEHSGLTVQETQAAIEVYEAAASKKNRLASTLDEIEARLMLAEADGSLAQRVRDVVLENRARALAGRKAA